MKEHEKLPVPILEMADPAGAASIGGYIGCYGAYWR